MTYPMGSSETNESAIGGIEVLCVYRLNWIASIGFRGAETGPKRRGTQIYPEGNLPFFSMRYGRKTGDLLIPPHVRLVK